MVPLDRLNPAHRMSFNNSSEELRQHPVITMYISVSINSTISSSTSSSIVLMVFLFHSQSFYSIRADLLCGELSLALRRQFGRYKQLQVNGILKVGWPPSSTSTHSISVSNMQLANYYSVECKGRNCGFKYPFANNGTSLP